MAFQFPFLRGTLGSASSAYTAAGFTSLKQTAITQLGYGKNCKLQLQFDSRYWNTSGPWGVGNGSTYTHTGYQNTQEVTRAPNGTTSDLADHPSTGLHP